MSSEATPFDHDRAVAEGWNIIHGTPSRVYDKNGMCKFFSSHEIMHHLRMKGVSSEFHRDAFMSLPWTDYHHAVSMKNGWQVRQDGNLSNREKVIQAAEDGDPLAVKALSEAARRKFKWQA